MNGGPYMLNSLLSLLFCQTIIQQMPTKLPDDISVRVENADLSALITDLAKAKTIDREGLTILRKKIALKATLDKQTNYRNMLGGDEKIEAIRGKLKQPLVARDLKKALNDFEGQEKEEQYKLFLKKYSITDDIMGAAGLLDERIEKAEQDIALTKKALDFFEEKLLQHRSKNDSPLVATTVFIEPPAKDPDIESILKEAGQKKVEVKQETSKESTSIRLAERFAK